jgi:hypothetical protein
LNVNTREKAFFGKNQTIEAIDLYINKTNKQKNNKITKRQRSALIKAAVAIKHAVEQQSEKYASINLALPSTKM